MYEEDQYGQIRRPEHDELPGRPRKTLVRKVRSVLWRYLRCRPHRADESWRMAWQWASACRDRDDLFRWGRSRGKWPHENEIASQYLLLALARMRESYQLRLPMHAAETVPPAIRERFGVAIGSSFGPNLLEHSGSAPTTAGERPDLTT